MKYFQKKIDLYNRLQDELDDHIWEVFSRYKKEEGFNFSNPETWNVNDNYIVFRGEDGCMGCYDPMSVSIPMKFFVDPDKELANLEMEIEEKRREDERLKLERKKKEELDELKRLKEKYEGDSK